MRERNYSLISVVLLLASIAVVAVPAAFVTVNPVSNGEAAGYLLGYMTPVALVGIANSALISVVAIRRGKRSFVQYATLAVAMLPLALVGLLGIGYLLMEH